MLKGLWLRLDIPYSEDASKMRAVLCYWDPEKEDSYNLLKVPDCKNIPEAVNKVYEEVHARGITMDSSLTLVFPLDGRHGLAGYARDEADKRKIIFHRHIPDCMKMPVNMENGYENFNTGSLEDTYDFEKARNLIILLNDEANQSYNSNDLLEAMAPLRHALWLALRHCGWKHPATMYTIRNLGYTLNATGNENNINEVQALILKLIYLWQLNIPDVSFWLGSETLLDETARLCVALDAEFIGVALMNLKAELFK